MYAVHADLDLFMTLRSAIKEKLSTQPFSLLVYNYNAFKEDQRNANANGKAFPFGDVKSLETNATDFNKDTTAMWSECDRIHGEVSQQSHALIVALSREFPTTQTTALTGHRLADRRAQRLREWLAARMRTVGAPFSHSPSE